MDGAAAENECKLPNAPCPACHGDCDGDNECADGLICLDRNTYDAIHGENPAPGCQGNSWPGKSGCDLLGSGCSTMPLVDLCVDPFLVEYKKPIFGYEDPSVPKLVELESNQANIADTGGFVRVSARYLTPPNSRDLSGRVPTISANFTAYFSFNEHGNFGYQHCNDFNTPGAVLAMTEDVFNRDECKKQCCETTGCLYMTYYAQTKVCIKLASCTLADDPRSPFSYQRTAQSCPSKAYTSSESVIARWNEVDNDRLDLMIQIPPAEKVGEVSVILNAGNGDLRFPFEYIAHNAQVNFTESSQVFDLSSSISDFTPEVQVESFEPTSFPMHLNESNLGIITVKIANFPGGAADCASPEECYKRGLFARFGWLGEGNVTHLFYDKASQRTTVGIVPPQLSQPTTYVPVEIGLRQTMSRDDDDDDDNDEPGESPLETAKFGFGFDGLDEPRVDTAYKAGPNSIREDEVTGISVKGGEIVFVELQNLWNEAVQGTAQATFVTQLGEVPAFHTEATRFYPTYTVSITTPMMPASTKCASLVISLGGKSVSMRVHFFTPDPPAVESLVPAFIYTGVESEMHLSLSNFPEIDMDGGHLAAEFIGTDAVVPGQVSMDMSLSAVSTGTTMLKVKTPSTGLPVGTTRVSVTYTPPGGGQAGGQYGSVVSDFQVRPLEVQLVSVMPRSESGPAGTLIEVTMKHMPLTGEGLTGPTLVFYYTLPASPGIEYEKSVDVIDSIVDTGGDVTSLKFAVPVIQEVLRGTQMGVTVISGNKQVRFGWWYEPLAQMEVFVVSKHSGAVNVRTPVIVGVESTALESDAVLAGVAVTFDGVAIPTAEVNVRRSQRVHDEMSLEFMSPLGLTQGQKQVTVTLPASAASGGQILSKSFDFELLAPDLPELTLRSSFGFTTKSTPLDFRLENVQGNVNTQALSVTLNGASLMASEFMDFHRADGTKEVTATVTAPAVDRSHAGVKTLEVTIGGYVLSAPFEYHAPPPAKIDFISPSEAANIGGEMVTLLVRDLGLPTRSTDSLIVSIGGVVANVSSLQIMDETELEAQIIVPALAGLTGTVMVSVHWSTAAAEAAHSQVLFSLYDAVSARVVGVAPQRLDDYTTGGLKVQMLIENFAKGGVVPVNPNAVLGTVTATDGIRTSSVPITSVSVQPLSSGGLTIANVSIEMVLPPHPSASSLTGQTVSFLTLQLRDSPSVSITQEVYYRPLPSGAALVEAVEPRRGSLDGGDEVKITISNFLRVSSKTDVTVRFADGEGAVAGTDWSISQVISTIDYTVIKVMSPPGRSEFAGRFLRVEVFPKTLGVGGAATFEYQYETRDPILSVISPRSGRNYGGYDATLTLSEINMPSLYPMASWTVHFGGVTAAINDVIPDDRNGKIRMRVAVPSTSNAGDVELKVVGQGLGTGNGTFTYTAITGPAQTTVREIEYNDCSSTERRLYIIVENFRPITVASQVTVTVNSVVSTVEKWSSSPQRTILEVLVAPSESVPGTVLQGVVLGLSNSGSFTYTLSSEIKALLNVEPRSGEFGDTVDFFSTGYPDNAAYEFHITPGNTSEYAGTLAHTPITLSSVITVAKIKGKCGKLMSFEVPDLGPSSMGGTLVLGMRLLRLLSSHLPISDMLAQAPMSLD